MTRSTRRSLFYALVAVFFVLGGGVVLYAQGWRLNFTNWHFEKTGGIYVRSYPADAQIYLNGKPEQNQSGFLSAGTLISDLFPTTYSLVLKEAGYDNWQENAEVLPSLATQFKSAVLVPQYSAIAASGTVKNFSLIGNNGGAGGNLILQNISGTLSYQDMNIGKGNVVSESSGLTDLVFKSSVNGNYYLYDFAQATTTDLTAAFAKHGVALKTAASVTIDPYGATSIIAASAKDIWLFNTGRSTTTLITALSGGASLSGPVAVSPSLIAWTEFRPASRTAGSNVGSSNIFIYNKSLGSVTDSSTTLPGQTVNAGWVKNNLLGVLQNDGSFYLYDTDARTLQELADDVKDFSATKDGNTIATLENKSVEIFSLNDPTAYYRFNLPDIADVSGLVWYRDGNHLFVVYSDHVSFLDLTDTSLTNFATVAHGAAPSYDPQGNSLYIVDPAGVLERFDFPS